MTSATPSPDRWLIARILLTVLGTLAFLPIVLFAIIAWTVTAPSPTSSNSLAFLGATVILAISPLLAFVFLAFVPGRPSGPWLRQISIPVWVCSALTVVSMVAIIIVCAASRVPVWLPITLLAIGAVGLGLALVLGPRLRTPARAARDLVLIPWREVPHKSWRAFGWVAGAVFVVVVALVLIAFHPWNIRNTTGLRATLALVGYLLAAGIGSFVVAIVCSIRYLPLANRLTTEFAGDRTTRKRIARMVQRPDSSDPDPVERELARRFAALTIAIAPAQLATFAFLYLGIIADGSGSALGPDSIGPWLWLVEIVALVGAFAGLVPLTLRRRDQARTFLELNGQPGVAPVDPLEPIAA